MSFDLLFSVMRWGKGEREKKDIHQTNSVLFNSFLSSASLLHRLSSQSVIKNNRGVIADVIDYTLLKRLIEEFILN